MNMRWLVKWVIDVDSEWPVVKDMTQISTKEESCDGNTAKKKEGLSLNV